MRFVPFLMILATIGLIASCSDDETSNGTDPGKPPCAPCAVVLGPDMDNTLYENAADTSNGSGNVMMAGRDGRNRIKRGLVHFDVSMIPAGSRIDSVQVRMRTVTGGQIVNVGLHRALAAWGEGTSNANCDGILCDAPVFGAPAAPGDATWFSRLWPDSSWSNPGGDFVANASATTVVGSLAFATYRWLTNAALVTDVQGWIDDPSTNYGWVIIGDESSVGTHTWFGTREIPEAALRPEIVVHYSD